MSQCVFSPCGEYLAGNTVAGQIAVWEISSGECIDIIEHPTSHNVSAMAWNPKGNQYLLLHSSKLKALLYFCLCGEPLFFLDL